MNYKLILSFVSHFSFRNVVVTQPGRNVWEFEHPWSTTLCSCCQNTKECNSQLFFPHRQLFFFNCTIYTGCFAFFCPCCFECKLYKRAGESMWTCCCPGGRFALRSKIRTAFRIEVNSFCNKF